MREETESQQEDSPESAWLSYHRSVLPCTERDCANVCACMSECMCMQMHRCAGCTYVHAHIQMRVHVDPWAAGRLWGGALSMGGQQGAHHSAEPGGTCHRDSPSEAGAVKHVEPAGHRGAGRAPQAEGCWPLVATDLDGGERAAVALCLPHVACVQ